MADDFRDCLAGAALKSAISEGRREDALKLYDQLFEQAKRGGASDADASAAAAEKLSDRQRFQANNKTNATLRALDARQRMQAVLREGGKRPLKALIGQLDKVNAEFSQVAGWQMAQMADFWKKFTTGEAKSWGAFLTNPAERDMVGRAKFGEKTGSAPHQQLAEQVSKVEEASRMRANNAGAAIPKREPGYGLTTAHDATPIFKEGRVGWVQKISQLLDLNKSIDAEGLPLSGKSPAELKEFLEKSWDDITTDGLVKSPTGGSGNLAESMSQRRFFEFKDYDSWKGYNKSFGMSHGDPINAIESNLSGMARDIAMIERFGPNPRATINWARAQGLHEAGKIQVAGEQSGERNTAVKSAQRDSAKLNGILNGMMGGNNPLNLAAAAYGTLRNLVYSRIAETAFLAQATGDVLGRQTNVRLMNGMPAVGLLGDTVKWMRDLAGPERKQMAVMLGLGSQDMMKSLTSFHVNRDHPIYSASGALSDTMARLFFVKAHMESLPRTFGMTMMGLMANMRELPFEGVAEKMPGFAESMRRHGITAQDWDAFRAQAGIEIKGAKFLSPVTMMKDGASAADFAVGKKFGAFVNENARQSVPALDPSTRYGLYGSMNPNSLPGMVMKDVTTAMYFSASTLQMLTHGFMMRQGVASRMGYLGSMGLALGTATAIQLQAKALVSGRDPYDMNPENDTGRRFWANVLQRSAAFGPAADFVVGGGSTAQRGGVIGTASKTADLLMGEAQHLSSGDAKDPNAAGKLFQIYRHFLPGADGWYTQAVMQHAMLDRLQAEVDPHAYDEWQRSQQFYNRNYGQQFWWGNNTTAPSRSPNFSSAWQKH